MRFSRAEELVQEEALVNAVMVAVTASGANVSSLPAVLGHNPTRAANPAVAYWCVPGLATLAADRFKQRAPRPHKFLKQKKT